jgi:hypothetical protein
VGLCNIRLCDGAAAQDLLQLLQAALRVIDKLAAAHAVAPGLKEQQQQAQKQHVDVQGGKC